MRSRSLKATKNTPSRALRPGFPRAPCNCRAILLISTPLLTSKEYNAMGYEPQADFGTPASTSEKMVTLTIDGREITVPEGTSVMRAATESGGNIPKLCATDSVKSFGSCRLCLVEIEGARGTPASCTTPVGQGMVVHTQ